MWTIGFVSFLSVHSLGKNGYWSLSRGWNSSWSPPRLGKSLLMTRIHAVIMGFSPWIHLDAVGKDTWSKRISEKRHAKDPDLGVQIIYFFFIHWRLERWDVAFLPLRGTPQLIQTNFCLVQWGDLFPEIIVLHLWPFVKVNKIGWQNDRTTVKIIESEKHLAVANAWHMQLAQFYSNPILEFGKWLFFLIGLLLGVLSTDFELYIGCYF